MNADTSKAKSASAGNAPAPPDSDPDVCPLCGGAGFVRRSVRLGHPDFGRAFPCECTRNEHEDARRVRLQRYCNLGPLARLTFENLSPRGRSPNPAHQERFAEAAKAARRFAEQPQGWLVFTGPSGSGKTHLAAAIAGACVERGNAALFMVIPDLLDHLRAAYQPDSGIGYDELFEMVRSAPALILDDLGVQSATPWAEEKLFQLINHRYTAQLPTVFTTNLDLSAFDPRIQSRLSDAALSEVYTFESGPSGVGDIDSLDLALLRGMTFKTFDPHQASPEPAEAQSVRSAHREALRYAEDPRLWLVIAGPTGRGKTRLAAAIANYCREAGMAVMFVVVPDLLDKLRSSYAPQSPREFDDVFEQVRAVPLLVLDDLGAQSGTPWADEKLFQIINYRYNASLPTVITTNGTKQSLDPRLFTRITDPGVSTVVPIGQFNIYGTGRFESKAAPTRGRPRRT